MTIGVQDIIDLQRFPDHESITTTRLYAETTAATLQRSFDRITDPAAHPLIAGIRQQRGDDATLIAADLLAWRPAELQLAVGIGHHQRFRPNRVRGDCATSPLTAPHRSTR